MYILSGYQTKTILPCWLQICCQRFEFTPQSTDWRLVDRKLWSKVELFVSSSSSFLFTPSCILPIPSYLCSLLCSHPFAFFNIRQCMPALFNQFSLSTDFRHRFQCVCLLFYLRPFFYSAIGLPLARFIRIFSVLAMEKPIHAAAMSR